MRNTRTTLKVLSWVWLTLILPFAWISIQVIEQLPRKGFPQNLYDTTLGFLLLPGRPIFLTCSVLALLLLATIVTAILALRSKQDETAASASSITTKTNRNNQGATSQIGTAASAINIKSSPGATNNLPPPPPENKQATEQKKALLHRYLNSVISKNKDLNPTSIHQSQALLSVNVPLEDIFIHIRAVSDRPVYDIGIEQQKLQDEIEQVRRNPDLDAREREDYIQALHAAMWHSQLGEELFITRLGKELGIEDVLGRLTPTRPAAVILGTPGSGKSTTLRWLALHMARASYHADYSLPENLAPVLLPIFLTIGDYARAITAPPSAGPHNASVKEFFWSEWTKISPDLPTLLEEALLTGRCLLLFDGLDEVASDDLRGRVRKDLTEFISLYPPVRDNASQYNRALITSRIVGYEPGPFASFAQYTLLDLNDELIQRFLGAWCPAVERYQARSLQGMQEELTPQQEQRALQEGYSQRDRLREALNYNPGLRRLAVNPLMLTILALIQKSGRRLPHRRIELYQTITMTLLNNWNQYKGGVIFSPEEIDLAEEVLSEFAYQLHSHDLPLTEKEVFAMTRQTMARYYRRALEQIQRAHVEQFIETLRSSSSLFVERGQGLYGFIHRTFQEYYTMRYLVDKQHYPLVDKRLAPAEDLKAFVAQKCHISTWHEPLLLLIAYKSEQKDRDERQQATALIEIILASRDSYDSLLHRHLLLAASALIDCNAWFIDIPLQHQVASQLLDTYGAGRYTELQQDIEKTALHWLRGQPSGSNQRPPLLEAWHNALCDDANAQRQQGAAKLLATIAPDLPTCPDIIRHTLIPPLLHLAGVQNWYSQELTCPPEIAARLFTISARPSSPDIEDYALVTLRLLDTDGPAGWLHADWLLWSEQQPELLERLTRHSLELNVQLTPAAFPAKPDDPNGKRQLELSINWKQHAHHSSGTLQTQLLQASSAACYPHAVLFKRLLVAEQAAPATAWQTLWERVLQEEMQQGRAATYQPALNLRLLLAHINQQRQQRIAAELERALVTKETRGQALKTLTNLYLRNLLELLDLRDLRDLRELRELLVLADLRELRDLRTLLDLRVLRVLLDQAQIIQLLCDSIENAATELISPPLFALYAVLTGFKQVPSSIVEQVQQTVTSLEGRGAALSADQRHLLNVIRRRFMGAPVVRAPSGIVPPGLPDQRITQLDKLRQLQSVLSRSHAEELLNACTDTRKPSKEIWKRLNPDEPSYRTEAGSIGEYAWRLLSQAWNMDRAAQQFVVHTLDNDNALTCAAAALLLHGCKDLAQETKQAASAAITQILVDEELSRRPLSPPEYGFSTVWRLDDVLFETLHLLAER